MSARARRRSWLPSQRRVLVGVALLSLVILLIVGPLVSVPILLSGH